MSDFCYSYSVTRIYENGEALLWSRLQDARAENAALHSRLAELEKRLTCDPDATICRLEARLAEAKRDLDIIQQCFEEQTEVLGHYIAELVEAVALLREARRSVAWCATDLVPVEPEATLLTQIDAFLNRRENGSHG